MVLVIIDATIPESVSKDYMTQNFGLFFDAGFTESSIQNMFILIIGVKDASE